MRPIDLLSLADHLWQSTLFVGVVWLITLLLQRNHPRVRYWMWMAASLKFSVPLAMFVTLGRHVTLNRGASMQPGVTDVLDSLSQPFSRSAASAVGSAITASSFFMTALPRLLLGIWMCGVAIRLLTWAIRWRQLAVMTRDASPAAMGRELSILRGVEAAMRLRRPTRLRVSDSALEPGIFGIIQPVVVWPRGIGEWLSDSEVAAILAHELCHLRRRDNLTMAMHMVVEALVWFHPLVWWLEAPLMNERERACDADVLLLGHAPRAYAESILKTCEFAVELPLACASGVTGSHLGRRIDAIMASRPCEDLGRSKQLLLSGVAVLAVACPLVVGMLHARVEAQSLDLTATGPSFEVASVKLNTTDDRGLMRMQIQPGGRMTVINTPLRSMIRNAYRVQEDQIMGGPDWIGSDRFDISAKADGNPTAEQIASMLRVLLSDRFHLTLHTETRERPIYALLLARGDRRLGPQIRPASFDCAPLRSGPPQPSPPSGTSGDTFNCGFRMGFGTMAGRGATMSALASSLSMGVHRVVLNRTELPGDWDLDMKWTPEDIPPRAPGTAPDQPVRVNGMDVDPNGPSIFTALREQLGLKLEASTGPVEVIVIDRAERPTSN